MQFEKPHSFTQEEALTRLQALTDYWSAKHGVQISWSGNTGQVKGKVKGVKFEGTMTVTGDLLTADIKAGFLAEKLGGKQYVESKLDDYLDPSNSVEALQARVPR
jgi:hypothetical protein